MKIKFLKQPLFQRLCYFMAVALSIFCLFFFIACTWIGYDVKNQCQNAQRQYGGDCVEALITLLNDEQQSFRARNSAIWALGQLGDQRALAPLQSFYTGHIPPREPLDQTISQYELKKSITLTSGGFNLGAIFWRFNLE